MTIDETKLNEFVNKAVGDVGATMSSILVVIGDRLGLWKAMAAAGPIDAASSRSAPRRTSATCASGSTRRRPRAT